MRFKPVTNRYNFSNEVLIKNYPEHLRIPIGTWIKNVLLDQKKWIIERSIYVTKYIDPSFLNELDIHFREQFPRNEEYFLNFIFESEERVTNFIALCLQNYARRGAVLELENILSIGGSAYSVVFTKNDPQDHQIGIADLVERVPEIIQETAKNIFTIEEKIRDAWINCYSRNPDYSKCVSKCVDALESLYKEKYFPNAIPTLGKFINDFKSNPEILRFKGNSLVNPKNLLTDIALDFKNSRGQHTSGTGRESTKEEAEFILHYTIFVFSIHH